MFLLTLSHLATKEAIASSCSSGLLDEAKENTVGVQVALRWPKLIAMVVSKTTDRIIRRYW